MTEEQSEKLNKLLEAHTELSVASSALEFMEKKLGPVNSTVCDFRKEFLKPYHEKFNATQDDFRNSGGMHELLLK